MTTYSRDYKYTTNAGPPTTGEPDDRQAILLGGQPYKPKMRSRKRGRPVTEDVNLLRNSFLVNLGQLVSEEDTDLQDGYEYALGNAFKSSASSKTTDTRAGGSIGVGGPPQFTRYSDIRDKGMLTMRNDVTLTNSDGHYGMGRIYSEHIEDPEDILYLQFGVPMFNSLSGYLTKFSDNALVKLGVTGKAAGFMYRAGQVAGVVLSIRVLGPVIALIGGGLWAAGTLYGHRTSRFYTINQQMGLYWSGVTTLVNQLAIYRGLLPRNRFDDKTEKEDAERLLQNLSELMPNLIHPKRGIDVPAIISISQRRTQKAMKLSLALEKEIVIGEGEVFESSRDFVNAVRKAYKADKFNEVNSIESVINGEADGNLDKIIAMSMNTKWNRSIERNSDSDSTNMMGMKPVALESGDKYLNDGTDNHVEVFQETYLKGKTPQPGAEVELDGDQIKESIQFNDDRENLDSAGFFGLLEGYNREGILWAAFRVNYIKSATETFTNETSSNSLGTGLNAVASTARSVKYSFAGGNLGDNMIIDSVEQLVSGIGKFVEGTIDGFTFGMMGSVLDLLRGVNAEIPDYWESSNASISTSSFTMDLVAPYNNVYSQIQNIDIPLAMILQGVIPVKSGAQSHVSPFLCKSHLRGKNKSELSMIKSVSVERGTTTMGFDTKGTALGVRVTFELVNLSPAISSPISLSSVFRPQEWVLDGDNSMTEYLQMLGALTLEEQTLNFSNLRLRWLSAMRHFNKLSDPGTWAMAVHQYVPNIPVLGGVYNLVGGVLSNGAIVRGDEQR